MRIHAYGEGTGAVYTDGGLPFDVAFPRRRPESPIPWARAPSGATCFLDVCSKSTVAASRTLATIRTLAASCQSLHSRSSQGAIGSGASAELKARLERTLPLLELDGCSEPYPSRTLAASRQPPKPPATISGARTWCNRQQCKRGAEVPTTFVNESPATPHGFCATGDTFLVLYITATRLNSSKPREGGVCEDGEAGPIFCTHAEDRVASAPLCLARWRIEIRSFCTAVHMSCWTADGRWHSHGSRLEKLMTGTVVFLSLIGSIHARGVCGPSEWIDKDTPGSACTATSVLTVDENHLLCEAATSAQYPLCTTTIQWARATGMATQPSR
eukprot:SAG31_NODE_4244_length_3423_cov_1.807461_3_plen_329_part_00